METELTKKVIFVMGVSGSGKSSIGRILADELSLPFIDADDHHPASNIEKMSQGIPLTDSDRIPWLDQLHDIAVNHLPTGCVMACSALKEKYRSQLQQSIESDIQWVYLKGDYETIFDRMKNRKDHFMDAQMLKSQFVTLEEPENVIIINIAENFEIIIKNIKSQLV